MSMSSVDVVEAVYDAFARDDLTSLHDAREAVVAEVRYSGTFRSTGRPLGAPQLLDVTTGGGGA